MTLRTIAIAALAVSALSAAPALADDNRCGNVAAGEWMSVADITAKAESAGYTVRGVDRDDGCYEVDATDSSGRKLDVIMHPTTGAVVHTDFDD